MSFNWGALISRDLALHYQRTGRRADMVVLHPLVYVSVREDSPLLWVVGVDCERGCDTIEEVPVIQDRRVESYEIK